MDNYVFESNPDISKRLKNALLYKDGTTIKDHVSESTYEAIIKIMEDNASSTKLDNYMPLYWISYIDGFIYETYGWPETQYVDMVLVDEAYSKSIPVKSINLPDKQYEARSKFSDALQEKMILNAIDLYYNYKEDTSTKAITSAWSEGDVEKLEKLIKANSSFDSKKEKAFYDEYNKVMVSGRADITVDAIDEALDSKDDTFVCVDSELLYGKDGALEKLEKEGFKVERIVK